MIPDLRSGAEIERRSDADLLEIGGGDAGEVEAAGGGGEEQDRRCDP